MSRKKATLEAVRNAVVQLRSKRQTPSASNIVELVGGSKGTVLLQLKVLMDEAATSMAEPTARQEFARTAGEPLVDALWEEAMVQANATYESRIAELADIREGFFGELEKAIAADAQARSRIDELENRIRELEGSQRIHSELDGYVTKLSLLINKLHPDPVLSALDQCLLIVAEGESGLRQAELRRRLLGLGYDRQEANQARYHAWKGGYTAETGEGRNKLVTLTAAGSERLASGLA